MLKRRYSNRYNSSTSCCSLFVKELVRSAKHQYLIAKPDFRLVPKSNGVGDVWEFTQEMKNGHPAPFPVALIDRIIGSINAQIILDPFMGSGTTAIVAMGLKRNYIGIELSPDYCEMAA